ncbi:MAG: endo-1,4-beta-xylanase [Thermoleophilaceae bacterium]|nr:endo-1,4-beta-xylanase [Thermoleophilaceae bacterium]
MAALTAIAALAASSVAVATPPVRPALPGASTCDPQTIRCAALRAGIRWGAATSPGELSRDPQAEQLLASEFSAFTPDNDFKPERTQPQPGQFQFAAVDSMLATARAKKMRIRGHVMFWYAQTPAWMREQVQDRESGLRIMRAHIRGIFEHVFPNRDLIDQWDIVNEAFEPDGTMRGTIWRNAIGPDYVEQAFRIAAEERDRLNDTVAGTENDWKLELYYNDFIDDSFVAFDSAIDVSGGLDLGGLAHAGVGVLAGSGLCVIAPRCAAIKRMAKDFAARGVPMDGIGFQAHIASLAAPDYRGVTSWIAPLGLRWAVTELDQPCSTDPLTKWLCFQAQGETFRQITAACVADAACDTVVQWGISDRRSWWTSLVPGGLLGNPLAFDTNLRRKPAANAVYRVLRDGAQPPSAWLQADQ